MSSARVLVFCALVSTGCRRPPPDEGAGAIESPDAGEARDAEGDAAESSTTWELDVGCRPPPAVTSPRVRACDGATCLFAHGKKMKLADGVEACAGTLFGERVQHLGMERYSVVHCTEAGVQITIVDLEKQAVLGSARAPAGQKNVWTDTLRASSGEAHPFIAPSYGDASPVDPTYGVGATWGHACVYDPTRASDLARCGPGFASFDVRPPSPFFREAGGYVMDLDGDGLDDPTFIFHQQVLSISGKTGAVLSRFEYDVAAATEPSSPKWFHSGRNYGSHSAFVAGSSARVVEMGAVPVGSFADYNCNVSRFLAVLEAPRAAPAWRLSWSRYVGFASTIFSKYEQAYAADPSVVVARKGDFVDGCLHRFSDGRTTIDGVPSILYGVFHAKSWSTCLKEQYALYLGSTTDPDPEKRPWSASKQKAWGDCQLANLKARGSWAMEALNESTGASVTGGVANYVWGWTDALTASHETLYLVETLPAEHAFDLSDVPPSKLQVFALVKGMWTARGTFPVAARPKIVSVPATRARGMGAYSAYAELSLRDVDCDGVADVELQDGTFVGERSGSFVPKP